MSEATSTRTVYLIRHGRTALNAEDRLRGLADPELDPVGVAQARATGFALREHGIGLVTSSPLLRARATATIIAGLLGVSATVSEGFNDRDYGPWTGELRSGVVQRFGSVDQAPDVEPAQTVRRRALAALDSLADGSRHGTLGVVTHDAIIRPILETYAPGLVAEVPNASWAVLRRRDRAWVVLSSDQRPAQDA
jgi:probable phosphoglycerate mutase